MRLGRSVNPAVIAAQRQALDYVRVSNPGFLVTNAQLRATEPSRFVFAVFYREPKVMTVPGRYVIVAVGRTQDRVERLETSPDSPYWIRGRK